MIIVPSILRLIMSWLRISDWRKTNKLSYNASKTRYVLFHTPQKQINPLHIKINDTNFEQVIEFNFLDLNINKTINWESHIDKIS